MSKQKNNEPIIFENNNDYTGGNNIEFFTGTFDIVGNIGSNNHSIGFRIPLSFHCLENELVNIAGNTLDHLYP